MPLPSIQSIIEGLIRQQPSLLTAQHGQFLKAVEDAAIAKGYLPENISNPWTLIRARYAIKAELSGKKRPRLSKSVANLVGKARRSALEAVATYNNPMSPFRSGSFIVHMHIAWNAMLLAIFMRRGIKPYYRDEKTGKRVIIDGEPKCWGLATCIKEY